MNDTNPAPVSIQKLIALWAFCESGLGGLLFALKIPLTGFLVGGFAVIIISLIAHFTKGDHKQVLQATLLVLMVKAAASPHSPLPAYLAVAFQGVLGALLFRFIKNRMLACILLGTIAMIESAWQKLIVLTLIFGNSFWKALDSFFQSVAQFFHMGKNVSFSFWLIVLYSAIYSVWGLIIGIWAARLPGQLLGEKEFALANIGRETDILVAAKKKNGWVKKLVYLLVILLSIVVIFVAEQKKGAAVYVIFRTLAAIVLLYFVVAPAAKWAVMKLINKSTGKNKQAVENIMQLLPEINLHARAAWRYSKNNYKGISRLQKFVLILILLTTEHE